MDDFINQNSSLSISFPNGHIAERKYVCDTLFVDFLGISVLYETETCEEGWQITLQSGGKLIFRDHFFSKVNDLDYISFSHIPQRVEWLDSKYSVEPLPVLYGNTSIETNDQRTIIDADIFAGVFFALTRWEEFANKTRDHLGRFAGINSFFHKHGLLQRPIVNEYVEFLWVLLTSAGYKGRRKQRTFSFQLSHDIDHPVWILNKSIFRWGRSCVADLVLKKDPALFGHRFLSYPMSKFGSYNLDIANTYDFIIEQSASLGLKNAFYFIPWSPAGELDGNYNLKHKRVGEIMRKIIDAGHEIGLHPSYTSSEIEGQIKREKYLLEEILHYHGINTVVRGGRQHYLRWKSPYTWREWEDAGLEYDSTLGYHDFPGFRCGICYDFPIFDFLNRKPLKLREYPLLLMEQTLFKYMRNNKNEQRQIISVIKNECKKYYGEFITLWHNDQLQSNKNKSMYIDLLYK